MSSQDLLNAKQATTVRKDGSLEFVTCNASIQPGRNTFANFDEFNAYLGKTFGGQADGKGMRGSMSRKGMYSRNAGNSIQPVTFGDPVLDTISSATGSLVIGGKSIDLREGRATLQGPNGTGGGIVAFDAPYLTFKGIVNGAERWASDDGAMVEYRIGSGRLNFHAWKKARSINTGRWAQRSASTTPMRSSTPPTRLQLLHDGGHALPDREGRPRLDRHDSYVDQYEWGWNSTAGAGRLAVPRTVAQCAVRRTRDGGRRLHKVPK